MKYKRIDGALHNFAHSFLSFMNYVDDEHVVDELNVLLRKHSGRLSINFSTGAIEPPHAETPRVRKSIGYWTATLEKHLTSEQVDPTQVADIVLHMRLTPKGYGHYVEAVDSRGVRHSVSVEPSA